MRLYTASNQVLPFQHVECEVPLTEKALQFSINVNKGSNEGCAGNP